jgi:hypothetical protein
MEVGLGGGRVVVERERGLWSVGSFLVLGSGSDAEIPVSKCFNRNGEFKREEASELHGISRSLCWWRTDTWKGENRAMAGAMVSAAELIASSSIVAERRKGNINGT